MKKVLITGAYGFVGVNLALFLKDKYELLALDLEEKQNDAYNKFYTWSNLDKIDFDQIHAIIHLAGKAHDVKGNADADIYFQINTELTKRVYSRFANSKAEKFFFFSSVKAAADVVEGEILTEEITPKPKGAYGESKIKAEEYILAQKLSDTKRSYILRPCMIHGPGNKGNLNLLYSVIKKGIPYPLGAFDNKRSFTSIDNLCFLIEQMLDKKIDSGIYNVGDDEPLSSNELIRLICKALDKPSLIWRIPQKLIIFVVRCGDVLHLPLNSFRLNKLTENYVVSNAKIKKAIGVENLPIDSKKGILTTIKSFG